MTRDDASLALLFPGQGTQEVGMGTALWEQSACVRQLFDLAERTTGLAIGDLCRCGPIEALTRTQVAQLAVVVTSLAAAAYLEERLGHRPRVRAVAGHSVGELAALCWAGALDPPAAFKLVGERGRLMDAASATTDGTMVAVIGLEPEVLARICHEASSGGVETVEVANLNAPGQVVLSGHRSAVAAASELARAAGARRVLPLLVGGPFHSRYMEPAAAAFCETVAETAVADPQVPVILNTTAKPATTAGEVRDELCHQVYRTVRWEESLRTLYAMGCRQFLELGHGQVLTGMVRRTLTEVEAFAAGTPESVAAAIHTIHGSQNADA